MITILSRFDGKANVSDRTFNSSIITKLSLRDGFFNLALCSSAVVGAIRKLYSCLLISRKTVEQTSSSCDLAHNRMRAHLYNTNNEDWPEDGDCAPVTLLL